MSPERYNLEDYLRSNGRLYLHDAGLIESIEVSSEYFGAEKEEVVKVLDEVEKIVSKKRRLKVSEIKRAGPRENSHFNESKKKLVRLGYTTHHSKRLLECFVEYLAEERSEEFDSQGDILNQLDFYRQSREKVERRKEEIMAILKQRIDFKNTDPLEPQFTKAITGEEISVRELRTDVSSELGEPLTRSEERFYRLIMVNGTKPISKRELYTEMMGSDYIPKWGDVACYVVTYVSRLRRKLGNKAVITHPDGGYITRSALIREMVEKNENTESEI